MHTIHTTHPTKNVMPAHGHRYTFGWSTYPHSTEVSLRLVQLVLGLLEHQVSVHKLLRGSLQHGRQVGHFLGQPRVLAFQVGDELVRVGELLDQVPRLFCPTRSIGLHCLFSQQVKLGGLPFQ